VIPAINRRSIFEYPYWDLHINLPLVHKLALMPSRGEGEGGGGGDCHFI